MAEHTVTIDAYNVPRPSDEQLAELLDALMARPELLGPSVSVDDRRGSIGLIVTVDAESEQGARVAAIRALADELLARGLVDAWVAPAPGQAVIVPERAEVASPVVDR